jgi:dethiobiotin synthetase
MQVLEVDKIGSATSPLNLGKSVTVINESLSPQAGDVVVVKALTESVTYGNLELPSGRLAKINRNDILLGVLGKRRALKGFFGDVPETVRSGDRLHLLNMGGVIGVCSGHHSSLSDAIEVEVLGVAVSEPPMLGGGYKVSVLNIADNSLKPAQSLNTSAPVVIIAGTCMNSGKTVAATEIVKQASHHGLRVAGAKMSGVACLRDTLNMQDCGAFTTASFLDCGLPSTVGVENLAPVAKAILNKLNEENPDLIVVELGDGIVGGYSVDSILLDEEIKEATSTFVFCASDYVGVIGGIEVLKRFGISIDVIAGSVTDSQAGEDFVVQNFGIRAGNARRNGRGLFELIRTAHRDYAFA